MQYPEITAEQMQEFERSISGILPVPPGTREKSIVNPKTKMPEIHRRWKESGRIVSFTIEDTTSQNGDDHTLYLVQLEITATKGSNTLVGQKVTFKGRINDAAYANGDKNDGQFKMSRGTLVRLLQLIRSAGFPVQGGMSSAQMAAYFPASGETPLIGREVYFEIHQQESDMAPSGWNEEVSNFYPLKVAGATAEV